MRQRVVAFAVLFAFAMLTAYPLAQAARPDDPLRELLTEVRGLRQALERSNVIGARIQLTVARLQLQEQRVSELGRRVTDLRMQLTGATTVVARLTTDIREAEDRLSTLPAGDERNMREHEMREWKKQVDQNQARRDQLAADESLLAQQLATEQGRWLDFNERLEELERSLRP